MGLVWMPGYWRHCLHHLHTGSEFLLIHREIELFGVNANDKQIQDMSMRTAWGKGDPRLSCIETVLDGGSAEPSSCLIDALFVGLVTATAFWKFPIACRDLANIRDSGDGRHTAIVT